MDAQESWESKRELGLRLVSDLEHERGVRLPQERRSIAELFQDMLRTAFQAGAISASSGETFETWYQREVLQ